MAGPTIIKLRRFWLQVHKWIGLLLAVLIIPCPSPDRRWCGMTGST
jgi:hypothetical protein